ncbi:zinc transporter ZIP9-like isoform X1 [Protopterus annectens]|uniref:zinc transporter ZIP9-like isoform X1 n=1 Tax=Protopterus annectens TaxID=7888 RepID=UPI001CFC43A8|nr:zinc transporter ZIP9-like isoform X1 [Protopterus annectens]
MDGAGTIILISLAMFVGCYLLGLIPLVAKLSENKLQLVTVLGAGLLCGTALAIIIPEGIELLENSSKVPCRNVAQSINSSESATSLDKPTEGSSRFFVGLTLVLGFILMFTVDQIGNYCAYHDPRTGVSNSTHVIATIGLVIHAAADGVALGAAVSSSEVTVQVVVFFAVILHKAPAAFGLVSFLMHTGLEKKEIQTHLLVFSIAAPLLAVATYFILSQTGGTSQYRLYATGMGMLFSAGTFLYVATVHVLPEASNRVSHSHGSAGYGQKGMTALESLTLIIGLTIPVLLSLGFQDG